MDDIIDAITDDDSQARPADVHPLVASDPVRYRELRNGAVYDNEVKRIVAIDNERNPKAINASNSAEYNARKWEQAQRRAREAIKSNTNSGSWQVGYQHIVGAMVDIAQDKKELARSRVEAARFIRQAAGLEAPKEATNTPVMAGGLAIMGDTGVLHHLLDVIGRYKGE